jgi:hypothetical protein
VAVGQWVPATDLRWSKAFTGWYAISLAGVPKQGRSLAGEPITIDGIEYPDGISTYPYSEIMYGLHGEYFLLRVEVGIDDQSPEDAAAIFQVELDGVPVYTSPPRKRGDPPLPVEVSLAGAQTLRLITARDPRAPAVGYASWADLKLLRPMLAVGETAPKTPAPRLARLQPPADAASVGPALLARVAHDTEEYVAARAGQEAGVVSVLDHERRRFSLVNAELALVYDAGGPEPNTLTVLDRRHDNVLLYRASLDITIDGRREVSLPRDATLEEDNVVVGDVRDRAFGPGKSLTIRLRARPDNLAVTLHLSAFANARDFLLQADVPGAAPSQHIEYSFFARDAGPAVVLGEQAEALGDLTRLWHVQLNDDGLLREMPLDWGKPAIFWGKHLPRPLLVAPLDEARELPEVRVATPPGSSAAALTLVTSNMPRDTASPRVYVEPTLASDLREAATGYKRVLDVLYPEPPMPDWVRFQWSSWYVFEMGVTHDIMARQVDLLTRHFADLGPWHVILDAGWYVAEGRPGSDMRREDRAKFPQGIRALVDYVHSQGVKLVTYMTTPYIDDRQKEGNWAGIRVPIEQHPEWLIPLGSNGGAAYAFNYEHPGLQAYLTGLMEDIFGRFNADGLLIDGLGSATEQLPAPQVVDKFGLVGPVVAQTMDAYRLTWTASQRVKPNTLIEGGWHNPNTARPYAHTWRQGDEVPEFSAPYPAPGLLEHIDYATYQKAILGQRPNMGALTAHAGDAPVHYQWLQAGIALDSHVTLSFDLASLDPAAIGEYRALLNHYRPFTGTTKFDAVLEPSVFVTRRGDTVYLGLLNRGFDERQFAVPLAEYGLDGGATYASFDLTSAAGRLVRGTFEAKVPPRAFRLYVLAARPQVVWTTSSYTAEQSAGRLAVELRGPNHVAGLARVVVPPPRRVTLDGRALSPAEQADSTASDRYHYDAESGLLTVRYSHDQPRRLAIEY